MCWNSEGQSPETGDEMRGTANIFKIFWNFGKKILGMSWFFNNEGRLSLSAADLNKSFCWLHRQGKPCNGTSNPKNCTQICFFWISFTIVRDPIHESFASECLVKWLLGVVFLIPLLSPALLWLQLRLLDNGWAEPCLLCGMLSFVLDCQSHWRWSLNGKTEESSLLKLRSSSSVLKQTCLSKSRMYTIQHGRILTFSHSVK